MSDQGKKPESENKSPIDIKMTPGVSSSVAEWKKGGLNEVQVGSMINDCPGYSSALYCFCFCSSSSALSIISVVISINRGFEYSRCTRSSLTSPS